MLCSGQHPDYRSIARFRARHLEALSELFVEALRLCAEAGLVALGHLALDGTKSRANASRRKAMSYERMTKAEAALQAEIAELRARAKALLEKAEATDRAEDERYGPDRRGDELPAELARRETRLAAIREAKAALEAEAAERERARQAGMREAGREPRKPDPDSEPPTPKPTAQRNFTDPESKIMKTSDGSFHQCFNAQAVVDSHAQVIVAAELTDEAPDARQLEPALGQLEESLEAIGAELPTGAALSADAGYFSEANVEATERKGLDPHIATGRQKHSDPPPIAPRGPVPKDATPRQRMARKLKTKRGQAVYARRKAVVEPVFGQMQTTQGAKQSAPARQARRPRPVALSLRRPQPAEAPPGRRAGADRGHVGAPPGARSALRGAATGPRSRRGAADEPRDRGSSPRTRPQPVDSASIPAWVAVATQAPSGRTRADCRRLVAISAFPRLSHSQPTAASHACWIAMFFRRSGVRSRPGE